MGQTATENNVYSERYVAFVDILGFTSHVHQSEHSPSEAQKLVDILDHVGQWSYAALQNTNELLGEDFKSQSFSDCTVLSEAATPKGLHHLLLIVTRFATDLLANGFLVRGGISKGLLHHSAKAIFGRQLDSRCKEGQLPPLLECASPDTSQSRSRRKSPRL